MYKVLFNDENEYLEVVVTGKRTASQSKDGANAWSKISNYCKKTS